MALEVEDPEERRRFLEMAQRDVARMERLLSDVREISRIDAHLDEEERAPVALDALLGGLVESFRMRSGDSGPSFTLAVRRRARHGPRLGRSPQPGLRQPARERRLVLAARRHRDRDAPRRETGGPRWWSRTKGPASPRSTATGSSRASSPGGPQGRRPSTPGSVWPLCAPSSRATAVGSPTTRAARTGASSSSTYPNLRRDRHVRPAARHSPPTENTRMNVSLSDESDS